MANVAHDAKAEQRGNEEGRGGRLLVCTTENLRLLSPLEQKPLLSSKALKKIFFSSSRILKIALHLTFKIVFDPTLFQLCSLLQIHSIP